MTTEDIIIADTELDGSDVGVPVIGDNPLSDIKIQSTKNKTIKELSVTLNTLQTGRIVYTTDEDINGFLESIIIEADSYVQVYITLADYDNIIVFDSMDIPVISAKYFPLRLQAISNKYEGITQTAEKWALNDKLRCEISGPHNTTIKLVFRYTN